MGGESGLSEREGGREEHFRVFLMVVGWLGVGWLDIKGWGWGG